MSVTLLCLVKGNTLANAFPVYRDSNQLRWGLKQSHITRPTRTTCDKRSLRPLDRKPPKRHIHVLVEPPVSTSASNEVLKLALLQALLNKSVHDREYRTRNSRRTKKNPALDNDGAELNMLNDSGKSFRRIQR
ncbi:hypothetical protein RhiirA1_452702 [Rhizophagus irregularis]|uniref:Uncharacterized protein n=1 Tax=Rhizophagus irregularis TaxID=588596 RepID=A0A2N0S9B9_9GLOM|nr:hypothetical protein RhiirA1_452702 [Rhizophagus irregularis]